MMGGCCGCLGLLTLLFLVIGGGLVQYTRSRRIDPERQSFNALLIEFCTGADQSRVKVNQIQRLLMTTFAQDTAYEELTAAVASFVPGGQPPFHNEAWLEGTFRQFLQRSQIILPEYEKEQAGVWPPPPNWRP